MADTPRLKEKYNKELKAQLKDQLGIQNVNQVPRLMKNRLQHGLRRRRVRLEGPRRRHERHARHHGPAAGGVPREEVHRRLQDPRGHAHRLQGHASRRPHVGVPGPPAGHGHPARPRLPRPEPEVVRLARQLLHGHHRAADLPRESTTTRSTAPAAWTSRSSPRPRATTTPASC